VAFLDPFALPIRKALSNFATYLNAGSQKKLLELGWLISAILVQTNHLQGNEATGELNPCFGGFAEEIRSR
jgi:hypothetical protein